MSYQVFIRNWWRLNDKGERIPDPGAEKSFLDFAETEREARAKCKEYNEENDPGELSRKAEYEQY
ncbi:MAG: hypothetical protein KAS32_31235 [Candidatus Peribacteraceae bacterium]|nr:hypothetical protein [Candidatus Peribacteraceae bacterium]